MNKEIIVTIKFFVSEETTIDDLLNEIEIITKYSYEIKKIIEE